MKIEEIDKICNYIKENPKCVINYCDNKNFVIFKDPVSFDRDYPYDWDVDDDGFGYIPNIALILMRCVKKGVDISQIEIRSC